MRGKKRQEIPSGSGRAVAAARQSQAAQPHAKVADVGCGCMSGIFHFVSKYHTRRKFLTFGRKQEAQKPSPPKPETTTTIITITCHPPPPTQPQPHDKCSTETAGRSSLELPRCPVISAEIRSSGSAKSPRVVARLMGIEGFPASPTPSFAADSVAEKRTKLLGALEKCDEDLKALKKIIDAMRESQTPPSAAVGGGGGKAEGREKTVEEEGDEEEEEVREDEPSPVSVLDYHQQQLLCDRCPPLTEYSKRARNGQVLQHQQKQHRAKTIRKLKPGEEDNTRYHFPNRSTPTPVSNLTNLTSAFLPAKTRPPPPINTARKTAATSSILTWSRAVVESVQEVCRGIERGQICEVGRIGLLIQDFIFKDLLEEIIKEKTMVMSTRRCDHVLALLGLLACPLRITAEN